MKLFLAVFLVAAAAADKLDNVYLPPSRAQGAGGSGSFLKTPFQGNTAAGSSNYAQATQASQASTAPIAILRYNNDNNGEGSYRYDFETENHIQQEESGQLKNVGNEEVVAAQGSYTFTAPDGQTFNVQYIADENGFQATGAHLPTAPPIPEEILKALEQNAKDEAAGIIDDGQYKPDPSEGFQTRNRQYIAPKPSQQQNGYKY